MKKRAAALLCLVLVFACVLTACGSGKKDLSNSKYVGTWKAVSMSLMDESAPFENEILLVLNADGTAVFSDADEGEESKCTWEETSDGLKLKGDAKMTFTDDGDGLMSKILGVELHFEKVS